METNEEKITWKKRWRDQDKERLLEYLMIAAFFVVFLFPYLSGMKQMKCVQDKTVFFHQCKPVARGQ